MLVGSSLFQERLRDHHLLAPDCRSVPWEENGSQRLTAWPCPAELEFWALRGFFVFGGIVTFIELTGLNSPAKELSILYCLIYCGRYFDVGEFVQRRNFVFDETYAVFNADSSASVLVRFC